MRPDMAELDEIAARLRKQRKSTDEMLEQTSARSAERTELLQRIETLRNREAARGGDDPSSRE